ncbi:MAG: MATE family efflux transporter [Lachnospiraceae bacterium]|nr:MATE family efflux transporter [Lachnospiraceae bacterium]
MTQTLEKKSTGQQSGMKDLTIGAPFRCILEFWFPVFLGTLFQQLYNMVDTMIVGKYLGLNQLAGVGVTGSLSFLVIGFCIGICSGFAIPVAQSFGAKDNTALRRYVTNSVWYCGAISLLLTVLTVVLCNQMLVWMNTPDAAFRYAYMYIVVIFAGIPFTILYNMVSGILRALGDSKSPVVFLIVSSVLNIGLDMLFIPVFGMDVEGAAFATVIAQGVSGFASLVYLVKKFEILKMQKGDWKPQGSYLKTLTLVGLPMGLQYSITAIGTIVLQTAVNSFGEIAVAGVAAANKVYSLISCPLEAMGNTMATFAGQNMGAKKMDRIRKGLYQSTLACIALSVLTFGLVVLFGNQMSLLFINKEEVEALAYAYEYILISTLGFPLLTVVLTVRFTIQGMGFSVFAMTAGVLEMAARCFVALALPAHFGFTSVCFANLSAWIAADLFLIPAFFYCKRKLEGKTPLRSVGFLSKLRHS